MAQRDKPLLRFRLTGILFDDQSQARARMSSPAMSRARVNRDPFHASLSRYMLRQSQICSPAMWHAGQHLMLP